MDRESREQANRTLREKLVERLEANRYPSPTLEGLMGQRREQEAPSAQEEDEHER